MWPSVIVLVREKRAALHSWSVPRTGRLGPIGGGPQRVLRFRSKPCQHASRPSGISMAMLSHPPLPLPRPRSGLHAVSLVPAHAPAWRSQRNAWRSALRKDCREGGEERGPGQGKGAVDLVELQGDIERRTPRWASLDVGLQMADASVRECERSRSTPVFGVVVVG